MAFGGELVVKPRRVVAVGPPRYQSACFPCFRRADGVFFFSATQRGGYRLAQVDNGGPEPETRGAGVSAGARICRAKAARPGQVL
jgi:hypothetical protein